MQILKPGGNWIIHRASFCQGIIGLPTAISFPHYHLLTCALISLACREGAFVHAITAAGVAHSVTAACSSGNIESCDCDRSKSGTTGKQWTWAGCNSNVKFGTSFSKLFTEAQERGNGLRSTMDLHNSRAGRKVTSLHQSFLTPLLSFSYHLNYREQTNSTKKEKKKEKKYLFQVTDIFDVFSRLVLLLVLRSILRGYRLSHKFTIFPKCEELSTSNRQDGMAWNHSFFAHENKSVRWCFSYHQTIT